MPSPKRIDWLNWMLGSSIPLCRLDDGGIPVGLASALLLEHRSRRFLLSTGHAIGMEQTDWMAFMQSEPGAGTAFHRLGQFNYVGEMTLGSGGLRYIDFCYVEVAADFEPLYQNHTPRALSDERPRAMFDSSKLGDPQANTEYAFSGRIQPEIHGTSTVVTTSVVYPGLSYLRSDGEFHVFQLPVDHPGHQAFKGCSGAPMLDIDCNVVGLVCDGDIPSNTVRTVSVSRYLFALNCLCDLGK